MKRRHGNRFVALPHYLLNSEAWLTMSPPAKALLIEVWKRHNGVNNGEISYSVREAAVIGLSRSAAARAFQELQDRGFLRMVRASSFTLKTKEARTWQITAEKRGNGLSGGDFMRWKPAKVIGEKTKHSPKISPAQSHQRDRAPPDKTILPVSVPPLGPMPADSTGSQSHLEDTYSLAIGSE